MFFLYSLQGLTPLPIELSPSCLGLLNSAHLRFAVQLYKLLFVVFLEMPNFYMPKSSVCIIVAQQQFLRRVNVIAR